MIRVLQEVATMDVGGVERLLYDYYTHLDSGRIAFDFVIFDCFYDLLPVRNDPSCDELVCVVIDSVTEVIVTTFRYNLLKCIRRDTFVFKHLL